MGEKSSLTCHRVLLPHITDNLIYFPLICLSQFSAVLQCIFGGIFQNIDYDSLIATSRTRIKSTAFFCYSGTSDHDSPLLIQIISWFKQDFPFTPSVPWLLQVTCACSLQLLWNNWCLIFQAQPSSQNLARAFSTTDFCTRC